MRPRAGVGPESSVRPRYKELTHGIDVRDAASDAVVGKSSVAGAVATSQTALSRLVMAAMGVLLPPVLMRGIETSTLTASLLRAGARTKVPVELGCVTLCMCVSVPFAVGLFEQQGRLRVAGLEDHIRASAPDPDGWVVYNKGI